jgi:hypothetical protein
MFLAVRMFWSPRRAFAVMGRRPRWVATFVLVCVCSGVGAGTYLLSDVGRTMLVREEMRSNGLNAASVSGDIMPDPIHWRIAATATVSTALTTAMLLLVSAGVVAGVLFVRGENALDFAVPLAVAASAGTVLACQACVGSALAWLWGVEAASVGLLGVVFPVWYLAMLWLGTRTVLSNTKVA